MAVLLKTWTSDERRRAVPVTYKQGKREENINKSRAQKGRGGDGAARVVQHLRDGRSGRGREGRLGRSGRLQGDMVGYVPPITYATRRNAFEFLPHFATKVRNPSSSITA
jgi:hypothetical protein